MFHGLSGRRQAIFVFFRGEIRGWHPKLSWTYKEALLDLFAQVDIYCERISPAFWAEPINAITNAAFLISAVLVFMWTKGRRASVLLLLAILCLIGIGSFLFHTFAQRWAGIADVLPILAFILTYIFLATRNFLGQPIWISAAACLLFVPYAAGSGWLISRIFGDMNGSVPYVSVALLIFIYALLARQRYPESSRGLAIGAGILSLSIAFRSIDAAVCAAIPLGTHFLWHILNGVMLGWMILVLHRFHLSETLAPAPPEE
jgi:hypothetical protein